MSAIQGLLIIEVNGRTVGTFRIIRYIMGVRFSGASVKKDSTVGPHVTDSHAGEVLPQML